MRSESAIGVCAFGDAFRASHIVLPPTLFGITGKPNRKHYMTLRGAGPLVEPFREPPGQAAEPPRTLRALSRIVDGDLCHRCGSCIGICPTGVLGTDSEGFPAVQRLSACTDCALCTRVCPGDEFDAPGFSKELFGSIPDYTDLHGHFLKGYLAYANNLDVRMRSTSGGLVTALLTALLESKAIDGAVVTTSDETELWRGTPVIARTAAEILRATKAKYAISPTNTVLQTIRSQAGRYAVVGLPCQIHGVLKASRLDRRLSERIVLTVGLFCHAAIEHDPMRFIWSQLGPITKQAAKFISRIGKHPGTPHLQLKDGTLYPVYFPRSNGYRPSSMEILNIIYRLYTPPRCLTCYDATAEFADIAVGDPWMAPPSREIDFLKGYSLALVRTKRGLDALKDAEAKNGITLYGLSEREVRSANRMMGHEKRSRAFRLIRSRLRQGLPVPDYHFPRQFPLPITSLKQALLTELNLLTHILCFPSRFRERGRLLVMRTVFSPIGYALLWLNHKRRALRTWFRDTAAELRRGS